ncbi:ribosomal RNA processing protein 1 homolog A-like [Uloborus diversus]|uniref:ribosomal RNA processing protein 1 homolog A-like n=1 Tax=Uloborus diversus TaxID=327109 RepID=UPI00240A5497|nr:ribosomal RNA processing protein 1 homolog A-like [Uloborus diversus]XP_054719683.1 ribosomal RNA processing protein 1 homolog A-like [Uloborus diversus]
MELTPEVEFAQKLVSNQPKVREKVLKQIGKWLAIKSSADEAFTEDGMLKLWKGLFLYFWNCDKPLFQEERADLISKYIHAFKKTKYSFLYMDTFFQTMSREWFGIDKYRIEKFMMFVRKFLRECFELLKRSEWNFKRVKQFRKVMKKTVISPKSESAPLGLKIHICDIYMEELARAGSEQLTPEMITWFLNPYLIVLWKCDDSSFLENVSKDVFLYLLNQDADEQEFHKFPVLKFDATEIQKLLLEHATKPTIRKLNRSRMYDVIQEFHY